MHCLHTIAYMHLFHPFENRGPVPANRSLSTPTTANQAPSRTWDALFCPRHSERRGGCLEMAGAIADFVAGAGGREHGWRAPPANQEIKQHSSHHKRPRNRIEIIQKPLKN